MANQPLLRSWPRKLLFDEITQNNGYFAVQGHSKSWSYLHSSRQNAGMWRKDRQTDGRTVCIARCKRAVKNGDNAIDVNGLDYERRFIRIRKFGLFGLLDSISWLTFTLHQCSLQPVIWSCYPFALHVQTIVLCDDGHPTRCAVDPVYSNSERGKLRRSPWWSGPGGIQTLSARPTGFLQCFDTVGLVIWPVKIVPDMTYNVFGGTLNLAQTPFPSSFPTTFWLTLNHYRWLKLVWVTFLFTGAVCKFSYLLIYLKVKRKSALWTLYNIY